MRSRELPKLKRLLAAFNLALAIRRIGNTDNPHRLNYLLHKEGVN